MVNSLTPIWRNCPEKSPLAKAFVFLRKPSVLSELLRSAEATIMLPIFSANTPSTLADAARVATSLPGSIASKSISGSLPLRKESSFPASSGLSRRHLASSSFIQATQLRSSFARASYSLRLCGKMANGSSGLPPRLLMVAAMSAPAAERGCQWVDTLFSKLSPFAPRAPFPMTVLPMMRVGRSVSLPAAVSASRIWSGL